MHFLLYDLGTQGDIWDSQKDMTAALAGGVLCMVLVASFQKVRIGSGTR